MAQPQVKETLTGYELSWPGEQLRIQVGRVHIHQDGRVTGELNILTDKKGFNSILYPPTQFNFSSDRTRAALVKGLAETYPDWPWGEVVGQLSLAIQDMARRGEPVSELWTSAEVARPEWLLEPILYKGLPTIIFGEKAVAKSTLALAIYACLALPWIDNPLGWTAPASPIKTLLADWEVDRNVAQWNAKQLQEGMDLGAFPLFYRHCSRPLADDIEQFQKHLTALGAEVLIVDSLGPAVGGKLNEPEQALAFTTALRKLKISTLIIGQTSKSEGKPKTRASVFGSAFFEYFARNIFELRKAQEEGEDTMDVALYNTYNNLGRRARTQGFHLSFNGSGTHIESQEITAPELVARLGTQASIQKLLLRQGAMSAKDIAEALDLPEPNIRRAISRLSKKGIIIKTEEGYGIST